MSKRLLSDRVSRVSTKASAHNGTTSIDAPKKGVFCVAAVTLAAVCLLFAVLSCPQSASATSTDNNPYTVDTVSPSGTTINLFDYWVHGDRTTNDYWKDSVKLGDVAGSNYWNDSDLAQFFNEGINAGHQFLFTRTDKSVEKTSGINWNAPDGRTMPTTGAIQTTLQNNYPALNPSSSYVNASGDTSLAYLFDDSAQQGKKRFSNVQGLLQQTDDGYYQYSSADYNKNGISIPGNFAEFDESTNSFNVYNNWAVWTTSNTREGQFFPFNKASEVFEKNGDGSLKTDDTGKLVPAVLSSRGLNAKGWGSVDSKLMANMNHFFGLSMATRFMQPIDGKTDHGDEMTYFFSGDDDALVYIDDVLIGDLSGIKDAVSIKINFASGEVVIQPDSTKGSAGKPITTTLKDCFEKAGRDVFKFNGDTFGNNTIHTLKFFYLERGNVDSNLALKYNLVDVPESAVIKVDQVGNPIAGAGFTLYAADENYNEREEIATGVTDWDGTFVLKNKVDGTVITFDELAKKGQRYFVLRETEAPEGYRKTGDIRLKYVEGTDDGEFGGHLLAEDGSHWETGAWSATGMQVKAANTLYEADEDDSRGDKLANVNNDGSGGSAYKGGTVFAVLLYFDGDATKGEINDSSKWHTVYGDSLAGWDIADEGTSLASIAQAAREGKAFSFAVAQGSGGAYQTNIEEMPGYLETYYNYIMKVGNQDWQDTKFTVGYYYTEAGSLSGATESNTHRLWMDGTTDDEMFKREYTIQMYVPNIQNYLLVQKTDDEWNPIRDGEGNADLSATFNLYKADQVDEGATTADSLVLKEGAGDPFDQASTSEDYGDEYSLYLNSGVGFPNKQKILPSGTYYLVEESAPTGYEKSTQVTKVVVNDDGVFADAGQKDDDVRVLDGVGTLVRTMAQFASGSDHDANLTLKDIIAGRATLPSESDPNTAQRDDWMTFEGEEEESQLKLTYAGMRDTLQYCPSDKMDASGESITLDDITLMNDEGWSRLFIRQNYADRDVDPEITSWRKTDIGQTPLDKLFSGVTIVQMRNQLQGSLVVGKQMQQGDAAIEGSDAFTMKVSLWSEDASGAKTPIAGTFGVRYVDANGAAVEGKATELTFDAEGEATVELKPGERIVLGTNADGGARLKPGTVFSVSEIDLPSGYSSPLITLNGASVEGDTATGTVDKASDPFRSGEFADTDNVSVVTVTNRTLVLGLELTKLDADTRAALAGAEFEFRTDDGALDEGGKPVYDATSDAQATLYPSRDSATPVTWSIATNNDGKLSVFGFERGKTYWLVETKTPAGGYQLLNPIAFTVGNDGSLSFFDDRGIAQATDGVAYITVDNKKPVQTLPMTGGPGNVPLFAAGMLLVGGAAFALYRVLEGRAALRSAGAAGSAVGGKHAR